MQLTKDEGLASKEKIKDSSSLIDNDVKRDIVENSEFRVSRFVYYSSDDVKRKGFFFRGNFKDRFVIRLKKLGVANISIMEVFFGETIFDRWMSVSRR